MSEQGTADRITSAALDILVREGAAAVTMRRVATAVGLTPMATYRHFANREALLRAAASAAFVDLDKSWSQRAEQVLDFRERLDGLMVDFLDFALGRPNLFRFLITDHQENASRRPVDLAAGGASALAPTVDVVAQGIREGALRDDDPLEVTLAITMSTFGLVELYLGGRMAMSEEDFRQLCRRTVGRILDGVGT